MPLKLTRFVTARFVRYDVDLAPEGKFTDELLTLPTLFPQLRQPQQRLRSLRGNHNLV